ncbi:MAG: pyruvate dehydrogenase complex dihydrolipoamide acetyltransferase [Hyphomicrobiales bacterium]|nr:pyruvate dehydrogenase complex dihydrolipoamide acetyltransferase [Hyphomicrobiales bacterium]
MSINILMPALSPTMEVGNLAKWLKKEGDPVRAGDVIAEIETDKATMEVEAVDEGTLGKIIVPEGSEDIAVNAPIAILLEEGEDASALKDAPTPEAAAAPSASKEAKEPSEPKGDAGAADEAGKAKAAIPGPATVSSRALNGGGDRVFASPLARRMAKQGGIDLAQLKGSGPHGRIVKADIDAVQSGKAPAAAPAKATAAAPAAAPMVAPGAQDAQTMKLFEEGSYDIVPHDNVRKIIAKRLIEAKTTIPHFYLTVDTEIDALLALRAEVNAAAPIGEDDKPIWKVSVNDMVIKALAMALQRVPDANVTWTEAGMLRHQRSDVGVAVSIPGGLITPVVRHAELKRLSEISNEMKDLAGRARSRKLAPQEYQGGTTAVSNLGMFGVKDFAAVINPPHATILAVGAGIPTPVVRDKQVEIRTIMTVTLSTDHRAVDGALGAKLLSAFKTLIEKPAAMLA